MYNDTFHKKDDIMCGRFTLTLSAEAIREYFEVESAPSFEPRFNIAPSTDILTACQLEGKRVLVSMRWGFIPHWQKEEDASLAPINARAETADEKPMFRQSFLSRRCLIIADGFYEWQRAVHKQPYYIHLKSKMPFGMAGLWDRWIGEGGKTIESCTILTTDANSLLNKIHQRMPVIIAKNNYDAWLDPANKNVSELKKLLKPYSASEMSAFAVSMQVNNPRNQGAECLTKVSKN